jgi:hypothetical protein
MFQICVPNQKIQGKVAIVTLLNFFLNAMIRNIKIHNILDIIGISKSMEPNKCTHLKKLWKKIFKCFFMIFQSSMGPG